MKKIRVTKVNKDEAEIAKQKKIQECLDKLQKLSMSKPNIRTQSAIEQLVNELRARGVNVNVTMLKRIRPGL